MDNQRPPIVLLTDFGYRDPFVGIMKGVVAGIAPNAHIIDLTHELRPQDVFQGAFALYRSAAYFPRGTVFCAVVDPGVGTDRSPLAISTRDFYFVGPDNGLLWPSAAASGIENCVCLDNPDYHLPRVSQTFHARDIFAPAAAHLWRGRSMADMGTTLSRPAALEIPRVEPEKGGLRLTVLDEDRFGNLTLNLTPEEFKAFCKKGFFLEAGGICITDAYPAYGEAPDDAPFLLAGSSGYMEVAVKNGSAARSLDAGVMDRFLLCRE
ncbi:MAG: SAM-dependent chlorinase/fluorinase [Desulfobacter sp.]|nr:MAG: SAM-dependent chlorinase/fluorinase [Desulfobacter sp.]